MSGDAGQGTRRPRMLVTGFEPFPGAPEQLGAMDFAGKRVIRGGAFNSSEPAHADPALRYPQDESTHTHAIGFRCAATPEG